MGDSTRHPPSLPRPHAAALLAGFAGAFALATLYDRDITHALFYSDSQDLWWRLAMKHVGHLLTWAGVGLLAWIVVRDWRWPASLVGAPVLGGGLAELLKLLIGRERPVRDGVIQNDAEYVWRPLFDAFRDGSNLGLPSSHAATAFAGAAMLAILLRRNPSGWSAPLTALAYLGAAACAVSRVLAGAHFATDVVLGALVGILGAHALTAVADTMSGTRTPSPATEHGPGGQDTERTHAAEDPPPDA
ncbi:MAG: phosphatase PAP2 family protein [Phycisphaerales bacterium JB040]